VTKKKKITRPTVSDGDFSQASNGELGNRVYVSVSKTINIGNYESIRVEFGAGSTVNDGESFEDVAGEVEKFAWTKISKMVKTVESHMKK
jgi:hypothetical protein